MSGERYVPAAGRAVFTRLYDPVVALTMREGTFRPALLGAVARALPPGGRVLDVGCGTGTFALALAAERPDAEVVGLDGDPEVLALARAKPRAAAVAWREGRADALPEPDGSADAVVASLLLHHLAPGTKRAALREAARVLRRGPASRLHVADWGRPHDPVMRAAFLVLQVVDGFAGTREHAAGALPSLIAAAGFAAPHRHARLRTGFGSLELLEAAPAL
jgi:ubiquinone/menaquinone biosynthesis C-methylase UbiE